MIMKEDIPYKDEGEKGAQSKKPRKRKKQIYNVIRQQMEFYFSNANLSKDRFLKKLIEDDTSKNIHLRLLPVS